MEQKSDHDPRSAWSKQKSQRNQLSTLQEERQVLSDPICGENDLDVANIIEVPNITSRLPRATITVMGSPGPA